MKQAFVRRDRHIVDRGMPLRHVTVSIKGPIFVAMGAKLLARRVVIFVTKTHGYFVIASDSEGGLLPNHQNFADDIKRCLTYLEQENANTTSVLFAQVATAKFGASGHSMGGGASILAAAQDTTKMIENA